MKDEGRSTHTQPPMLDEAGLIAYLKTQPDIIAAYLFGSLAQGKATPRSDIDIAVFLKGPSKRPADTIDRQLQLMNDLSCFADREVDVVVLNAAPPVLKDQILRYGRRLYESDLMARVDFEVRTGQEYADLKPMYDFFNQDLFQKIKEVGLSGRRRRPYPTTSPAS